MASDFDKQIKGIFNTVRSTINPDYAIPKEKANEPMNIRIKRMKDSAAELNNKIKELSTCLSAFTTNLNALTEEIQPYIAKESQGTTSADAPEATTDAEAKPAEATPAPEAKPADNPSTETTEKAPDDDKKS